MNRIELKRETSTLGFHPLPDHQLCTINDRALSNKIFARAMAVLFFVQLVIVLSTSLDYYFVYKHRGNDELEAQWPFFIKITELGWLLFVPAIALLVSNLKLSIWKLVVGLVVMGLVGVVYSAFILHPMTHIRYELFTNRSPQNLGPFFDCLDCLRDPGVWFDEVFGSYVHILGLGAPGIAIRFWLQTEATNRQTEAMRRSMEQLRYEILTNRLQPHFLFNTLNTISALTTKQPERAREMVGKLGALLRNSIESMDMRDIRLSQEYDLVGDYLAIQKIRYGDRLNYDLQLPQSLTNKKIPAFILQPLVENSVKHGFGRSDCNRNDTVNIRVEAKLSNQKIEISVCDDGCGLDVDTDSIDQHLGLGLTRERLDLQYGAQADVKISSSDVGGFSVTLIIPSSNGKKSK